MSLVMEDVAMLLTQPSVAEAVQREEEEEEDKETEEVK